MKSRMCRGMWSRMLMLWATLFVWGMATLARGQLEVSFELDYLRTLLYEAVPARVVLRNTSASPIMVGGAAGQGEALLRIDIEREPGRFLPALKPSIPGLPLEVPPGARRVLPLDLASCFPMQKTGQYIIKACVSWRALDYCSAKAFVDVSPGLEQARIRTGSPDGARVYTLRSLYRNGVEGLFLRIEDPEREKVYGVLSLGGFVKLAPPRMKVDQQLRLHVFYQLNASRFAQDVFDAYGHTLDRAVYQGSIRHMQLEPDGKGGFLVKNATPQSESEGRRAGGWRIRDVPR